MARTTRAGEPHPRPPLDAGTQALGPSLALFPGTLAEIWMRSRAADKWPLGGGQDQHKEEEPGVYPRSSFGKSQRSHSRNTSGQSEKDSSCTPSRPGQAGSAGSCLSSGQGLMLPHWMCISPHPILSAGRCLTSDWETTFCLHQFQTWCFEPSAPRKPGGANNHHLPHTGVKG